MKTLPVVLLVAAVFNSASGSARWAWITGDKGTELINLNQEVEDSDSTSDELKEDVDFYLFTNSNPEDSQTIYLNDDYSLESSNFDVSKPTRILIHGWQSSSEEPICVDVRDAYLTQGDYNVICVDWSAYAAWEYMFAKSKIITTGQYIGSMIDYLVSQGLNIADLIIVGHSLGAHVAGQAGRNAASTVPTLIALDPAGPLLVNYGAAARMNSSDAEFVQVIHTNTGLLGHTAELGDVDIWPNGGEWQNGCNWDITGSCSHRRSYLYFIESIPDTDYSQFTSYKCESYDDFSAGNCADNDSTYLGGSSVDRTASGNYYLDTNSESLYSLG